MYFLFIFLIILQTNLSIEFGFDDLNKFPDILKDGLSFDLDTLNKFQTILSYHGISVEDILKDIKSNADYSAERFVGQTFFGDIAHVEPDQYFNARQMIEYRGFKYEEYEAITEDCYILTLHRIINPQNKTLDKPPVLLVHGILDDSTEWLRNSLGGNIDDEDDRNLAFALAKRGFDVWLANYRGNTYSRKHTVFSNWRPIYYRFNYDNHAIQDLPAIIGKIQSVTNYDQIQYVGYSQGTSTMFELLALKPNVSEILSVYVAEAPVSYAGNISTPLKALTYIPGGLKTLLYFNTPILTNNFFYKIFLPLICGTATELCQGINYFLAGYSNNQVNSTRVPVYFSHLPAGTSLPNLIRFAQTWVNGGKNQMIDYMFDKKNLECYGSKQPRRIPIEKINMKNMKFFYGSTDKIADKEDVQKLIDNLTVQVESKEIDDGGFGHLDFIFSKNIDKLLNNDVIKILQSNKPLKTKNGLRFREYNSMNCNVPNKKSHCHIKDIDLVLNRMFN